MTFEVEVMFYSSHIHIFKSSKSVEKKECAKIQKRFIRTYILNKVIENH